MKKLLVDAWKMFWDDTVRDMKLPLKVWCLIFLPASYICILVAVVILRWRAVDDEV